MADRYTVSENPFGFEADVGTARLRYALTDNRPTHVSVYRSAAREHVLEPNDGRHARRPEAMWRHICYGAHKEDLQLVADIMNRREAGELQYIRQERNHGL